MSLPFPLQPDEAALALYRRHWVYVWPVLALYVALALLPLLLSLWLMPFKGDSPPLLSVPLMGLGLAWGVFWLVHAYLTFYRYRNDIWVLTNQRLVDSYKAHWFHQRMATADLVNLQNISIVRSGVLQTLLNYGDVECETAGERQLFVLSGIPGPSVALAEVDRARDAARSDGR